MKTPLRDYLLTLFVILMMIGKFLNKQTDGLDLYDYLGLIGVLGMMVVALVKLFYGDFRKKEKEDSESKKISFQPKKFILIWVVCIGPFAFYYGYTGNRNQLPPESQIIKQNVGEPDHTGWIPVTSTDKSFFAYFPAKYTEMLVSTDEMKSHVIATNTTYGQFAITKVTFISEKTLTLDEVKESIIKQSGWDKYIKKTTPIKHDKFDALKLEIVTPEFSGEMRIFISGKEAYGITVQYAEKATDLHHEAYRNFINSVKLIKKENNLQQGGEADPIIHSPICK